MIDLELLKQMKTNYTPQNCISMLMQATVKIASAVGVKLDYTITALPEQPVKQSLLAEGLTEFTTVVGAISVGCNFNPSLLIKRNRNAQQASSSPATSVHP